MQRQHGRRASNGDSKCAPLLWTCGFAGRSIGEVVGGDCSVIPSHSLFQRVRRWTILIIHYSLNELTTLNDRTTLSVHHSFLMKELRRTRHRGCTATAHSLPRNSSSACLGQRGQHVSVVSRGFERGMRATRKDRGDPGV